MSAKITVETSAGGIVPFIRNGEIVVPMVTTVGGGVSFPKGHLEDGETPEVAALREMEEEVGLKSIKVIAALGMLTREKTDEAGNVKRKNVHIFLMTADDIVYDHEDDFVWIPLDGAIDLMQRPEEATLLREYESRIRNAAVPAFRSIDQSTPWDDARTSRGYERTAETRIDARDGEVVLCLGVGDQRRIVDLLSRFGVTATVVDISDKALGELEASARSEERKGTLGVLRKDVHDLLSGDLPDAMDRCLVQGALNLSDTKTFYVVNEIVRKMKVGALLFVEGLSGEGVIGLGQGRTVGKNLFMLDDGRLVRQWNEEFLRTAIAGRLKLAVESLSVTEGHFAAVLKKVEDYAY